ncbi:MAG: winged helix-turn-helix transcriptional regulator [Planctomycetes bacterium]|nr:winged helix-turn-helix transcriptional regulator [Planctomycetota bacterium]
MDTKAALVYVREFLRLYWANEAAHEVWSRELEAQHGMTAKQYGLLRAVERQADITTTDLTELLGKAQPAITQMLNRLENNGFITREASSVDKRKRELHLTPKAQKVLDTVDPIGPTRVALGLEHATDREAGEIVRAMELLYQWQTQRKLKKK